MVCLIIMQCIKFIGTYYKNGDSATVTYCALTGDCGLNNSPTTQAIAKIVKKFEETGVVDRPENIAILSESVAKDPNVSIPHRSQELELSYGTLWRNLHLDLRQRLYKVQLVLSFR